MSRIVQEKFQVSEPLPKSADHQWVSDKSARTKKNLQTRSGMGRYEPYTGDFYNSLPPGSEIADQEVTDQPSMSYGGQMGSGTQVTDDVNAKSLREGFDRKPLRPTDDMYTREHQDAFYDSIVVDGVEGFVERNNTLDRE